MYRASKSNENCGEKIKVKFVHEDERVYEFFVRSTLLGESIDENNELCKLGLSADRCLQYIIL